MSDPTQLQRNAAWIAFKLNDAPVQTAADGDFNVVALMEATSGYILGMEFVHVAEGGMPAPSAKRLLSTAMGKHPVRPKVLMLPAELAATEQEAVATDLGMAVQRVDSARLSVFTNGACAGFKARFGGSVQ